jgi:hypothetical protein
MYFIVKVLDEILTFLFVRRNVALFSSEISNMSSENFDDETDHKIPDHFNDFISHTWNNMKNAATHNSSSVQELTSPVKLPPWLIDEFTSEIQGCYFHFNVT